MPSAAVLQKLRLPLLLAAGVLIWLTATERWSLAAWQTPAAYVVDALEMLARLKLSSDKGLGFLIDKHMPGLGAPWVADWSAYPMPDTLLFIVLGWTARVIGLIPASNLALLADHLAAVAVFYGCSRALGHRAVFAAAGALCFGFSFYLFHRGLSHYSFALAYIVPAQLLSAWLIGASRRLLALRRWRVFCLATAAATGASNPYFGFAYCQLLAFALAYQAATGRDRRNLRLGAACLGVFALILTAVNYSAIAAMFGGQQLLERNYAGTEVYGLRLIELFIPSPAHHWAAAAELGRQYGAATVLKGELYYPYFGLAGLAGLAVVLAGAGRALLRRRTGLRPAHAPIMLWFTLFFMVGGLNSLLAFAGVDLFRAGNRYSIYLLAVALLALVSWASRHGRRLGSGMALAVTLPVVLLCLWDQTPRLSPAAERAARRQKVDLDQRLARTLAAALPAGAAVFELPALPFLEQPPVNRMTDYELFRPWLYADGLRFSYGLLRGEKGLAWQQWVATRPAGAMCAALEKAGYAALYLHKGAFADAGAALHRQLAAAGLKVIFDEGDHLVFALQPAASPQLPDLTDERLAPPWAAIAGPDDQVQIHATQGWFGLEQVGDNAWRWAGATATATLWCPGDHARTVTVQFGASTLKPARLSVSFAGQEAWQAVTGQPPAQLVQLTLRLQPGPNQLAFYYAGQPVRPSTDDPRRLGFRIDDLRATFVSSP